MKSAFRRIGIPKRENDLDLGLGFCLGSFFSLIGSGLVVVEVGIWGFSFIGRVKLSRELAEERGEEEGWGRLERRWRGRRWPWKKISSAGDKSTAIEGCGGLAAEEGGWWWWWSREIVKENSCAGEEEAEGGEAAEEGGGGDLHSVLWCWS